MNYKGRVLLSWRVQGLTQIAPSQSRHLWVAVVASGLLLTSLFTLALGKPTPRNLTPHESLEVAPSGFSLTGSADPSQTLDLRLALVQGNVAELERRLYEVSTPSSSNYGKHLSQSEV